MVEVKLDQQKQVTVDIEDKDIRAGFAHRQRWLAKMMSFYTYQNALKAWENWERRQTSKENPISLQRPKVKVR